MSLPRVCEGAPSSIWHEGMLSECFEQVVIMPAIALFFLVGGIYRLIQLLRNYTFEKKLRTTHVIKILCCVILALSHVGALIAKIMLYETWYWFQLQADIRDLICWVYCAILISLELRAGTKHFWVVRAWWVLYFVAICLVLQSLRSYKDVPTRYAYFDAILRFVVATLLTILGLWVKEGKEEEERQKLIEKQRVFGTLSLLEVEGARNPYEDANIFSKILLLWPSSIVALGSKRPLDFSDLWQLPKEDTAEDCVKKLENNWFDQVSKAEALTRKTNKKHEPSLFKALWAVHGRMFVISGIGKLIQDIGTMSGPVMLYFIILYLEDSNAPLVDGLWWVGGVFISFGVQSLGSNISLFILYRISNQVRSAITAIVYRKAVRISSAGKSKFSAGEIINYQSIDANRVAFSIPLYHLTWSAPLQIVISMVLIYRFLGMAVFAGLGVVLILIPLNSIVARKMVNYQRILMQFRDRRIRIMSELLSGIRLIKFFNWENYFSQRAHAARKEEIGHQKKSAYAQAFLMFFVSNAPLLVSVACFSTYVLIGNTLNPQNTFTALALIYSLRVPLGFIPMVIGGIVESRLSLSRLQRFLLADDMDANAVTKVEEGDAIRIENASFQWTKDSEIETLKNINLRVKHGELVAVVGTVGSGKSSLLAALLGEIHKSKGNVYVNGSIAYVPQQAWMQNTTLRSNILFGKQYEDQKYRRCVHSCELMADIKILPNADYTEIGEKGINLSGGQKQRISLARAAYQEAAIYLLDSPLSAVDAHVGSAIFENLITGDLAHTARIFVTHQLDLLRRVDKIVVMHEGTIAEMGSYNELMSNGLYFAELLTKHVGEQQENGDRSSDQPNRKRAASLSKLGPSAPETKAGAGKLIEQEEKMEGAISWKVYKMYLKSAGFGFVALTLFFYVAEVCGLVGSDSWLSFWSSEQDRSMIYLIVYVCLGVGTAFLTLLRSFMLVYATIRAAIKLHDILLARILHVPMYFFDTTPIGRVINRFSRDLMNIDSTLPTALGPFIITSFNVLAICAVISVVTPFFLVPLLPISYAFYWLHQYYMTSSREVQRLDSVSKSPIYALFSETLNGMTTIRAYEMINDFINNNDYKIDRNMKALFVVNGLARWFAIRLELLCNFVVTLATLFCVVERSSVAPALAGLSISYAMQLTVTLNYLVRQFVDVETNIISVERVVEYADLPLEGSHDVSEISTPADWPMHGEIHFQDLRVKYREDTDLVLKGLTATIKGSEKIGIVGRTGAGKSSLFLALFRLVEADKGAIYIDNVNIAKLGLSLLRSRLAIIPQDPVLFTGTIRSNLDPFSSCEDREIWEVLESIHMRAPIDQLPGKLDCEVEENGDNFSVGQRQLLCLGRALLRKAKILLMDEATASVDIETDELIQQTIREKFKDITVLTIAHRINTILDSDRVMVLDKGRIVEYDTPKNLASDEKTIFYSLLQESRKNMATL